MKKGSKHSEETKHKMSESLKGRKSWNKGLTKETDERIKNSGLKISKIKKGKPSKLKGILRTENDKKKISINTKEAMNNPLIRKKLRENHADFSGKNNPNYGKKSPNTSIRNHKNWIEGKIVLPKKDTSIEIKIQNFLKQLHIEFFTHQYIKDIEHGYQCDILIPSKKIIIECFGDYWHKCPIGREIDILRCQELRERGYRVFVFWENEIRVMELNDLKNKLQ